MLRTIRTIATLPLALELAGLAIGPAMAESQMSLQGAQTAPGMDAIIEQVTEELRQQGGAPPEAADVVAALNGIAAELYQSGHYPEAPQWRVWP